MHSNQTPQTLRQRTGFVLVLTLVLLALAATAMIAISRTAIAHAQRAAQAQEDLQERWAMLTCRAALLPKTEKMLHDRELLQMTPVSWARDSLTLGGQTYGLIFSDESAKANVATIIKTQDLQQAALTIRRLSLNSRLAGRVQIRSFLDPAQPSCFGEVFDRDNPEDLCVCPNGQSPAELLTCWGDGRLNIHRAGETVMREICSGVLSYTQIEQLRQLQQSDPTISLENALRPLQLSQKNAADVRKLLKDSSSCHSLWIYCDQAQRRDWSLAVTDQDPDGVPTIHNFVW